MKTKVPMSELRSREPLAEPCESKWFSGELAGQVLGCRVYDPGSTEPVRVINIDDSAWSVHASTPRDVDRTGRIAAQTKTFTIAIETPGMGPSSGPLTDEQHAAMKDGDWSVLGAAQWELIKTVLAEHGIQHTIEDPLVVNYLGYSLSASSLIGLLASAPDTVTTGHFVSWENVALAKRKTGIKKAMRIGAMMLGFAASSAGLLAYQKKRAAPIRERLKQDLEQEINQNARPTIELTRRQKLMSKVAPIIGMAACGDAEKLRDAIVSREEVGSAQVHLWHGGNALLSSRHANRCAAKILTEAGIQVDYEQDEDGGHNVEDATLISVPRYAEALAR